MRKILIVGCIFIFVSVGCVVDPKNWTLPLGVEFTRKEVYYAQEAQKF